MVVGRIGGRVVAAVLIQTLSDAADLAGPALEGGHLGQVDQPRQQVGQVLPVAIVSCRVDHLDVLPADPTGLEGLCELWVATVQAGCGVHPASAGVRALLGAVGQPHRGGVAVFDVADTRRGHLGEQYRLSVIDPPTLCLEVDQLGQRR